jgi:hypothetical protein
MMICLSRLSGWSAVLKKLWKKPKRLLNKL